MKATKIWVLIVLLLIPAINVHAWPWPDTRQTKCYDNSAEIACPALDQPFYGQDGNFTINPQSYTKLDASGNAFTWCDTNPATNGRNQGTCCKGTGDAATDTGAGDQTPTSLPWSQLLLGDLTVEKYPAYLPTMTINTANAEEILSKDVYLTGTYEITDLEGIILHEGSLEIKGRGNSTWTMPKKPYRLKLTDNAALLGMPSNKHWVLLANYSDKTLMRNDIAFELSRMLGMEYTPRSVFVELYLNGSYQGIYQLTEHIRIGKNRVNIPELKITDTSADKISGGYLIEVDANRGEDFCFDSTRTPMVFCFSNPETLLETGWEPQRQYIVDYINRTDEAIFGEQFKDPDNGYAAYIDVDSAIHYYLINELFKNVDGDLWRSTFLFKKRDGKLTFGPIWDFDIAIGNVNYGDADKTDGWHIRKAPWFTRMFEDPSFKNKVRMRWAQMKRAGMLNAIFRHIDIRAAYLDDAQVNNFKKWPILDKYVWPNRVVTGSYQGEIDAMKEWLALRIAWMDAQFLTLPTKGGLLWLPLLLGS